MKWPAFHYRTLALVYAAAILVALYENQVKPPGDPTPRNVFVDPKFDYADAMSKLYPGRGETEFFLGMQAQARAGTKISPQELQQNPLLLPQFMADLHENLTSAAAHYERAIAAGLKSEEDLYYYYALTLMRLQEEPQKIDEAIAAWRRQFPHSDRKDLELRRRAIEAEYQGLHSRLERMQGSKTIDELYGPKR